MGKLMALALVCTMAAAVLFKPVLMGRPRQVNAPSEQPNLRDAAEESGRTLDEQCRAHPYRIVNLTLTA